ncbi:hypothetical protein P4O66_000251 [Electrophorus voltai]|uniref:Uncharacterized protein n=1 Tax=Electrophorus voltai TaxID=2609070 RepID=A0AAD8ZIR9_9TELE|nr:hypothetical protein P4O66_000251 [Electrophorus voltai]
MKAGERRPSRPVLCPASTTTPPSPWEGAGCGGGGPREPGILLIPCAAVGLRCPRVLRGGCADLSSVRRDTKWNHHRSNTPTPTPVVRLWSEAVVCGGGCSVSDLTAPDHPCAHASQRWRSTFGCQKGVPSKGVSAKGISSKGVPSKGVSSKGVSTKGVSSKGVSTKGVSPKGVPSKVVPSKGVSSKGISTKGVPLKGHPLKAYPLKAYPPKGVPLKGHPLKAYPLKAYPPKGVPLKGYPLKAYPLKAYPLKAYPPKGPNFPLKAYPPKGVSLKAYPLKAYPLKAYPPKVYPLKAYPLKAYPLKVYPLKAYPLKAYPPKVFGSPSPKVYPLKEYPLELHCYVTIKAVVQVYRVPFKRKCREMPATVPPTGTGGPAHSPRPDARQISTGTRNPGEMEIQQDAIVPILHHSRPSACFTGLCTPLRTALCLLRQAPYIPPYAGLPASPGSECPSVRPSACFPGLHTPLRLFLRDPYAPLPASVGFVMALCTPLCLLLRAPYAPVAASPGSVRPCGCFSGLRTPLWLLLRAPYAPVPASPGSVRPCACFSGLRNAALTAVGFLCQDSRLLRCHHATHRPRDKTTQQEAAGRPSATPPTSHSAPQGGEG